MNETYAALEQIETALAVGTIGQGLSKLTVQELRYHAAVLRSGIRRGDEEAGERGQQFVEEVKRVLR
jgi:hypothetical protein